MPSTELITISGIEEVQRNLASLPSIIAAQCLQEALSAGGHVIAEEVQSRVPVDQGDLQEHVRMVVSIDIQKGGGVASIGFDRSSNDEGFPWDAIALWVEYGHHKFIHGKDTGEFVPAHPFMRPAAVSSAEPATEVFIDTLANKINEVKSLGS